VTQPLPIEQYDEPPPRGSLTESLLDNLPVWTIVSAAISFLYLVWATIEILARYTGTIPKVGP
jgi:hypothetical protein